MFSASSVANLTSGFLLSSGQKPTSTPISSNLLICPSPVDLLRSDRSVPPDSELHGPGPHQPCLASSALRRPSRSYSGLMAPSKPSKPSPCDTLGWRLAWTSTENLGFHWFTHVYTICHLIIFSRFMAKSIMLNIIMNHAAHACILK